MRISRKKKKPVQKKEYFSNEGITSSEVLVLDSENNRLGVMKTGEAIRKAREEEMDLVLINPKTEPPVAKIMDFGQYRYQKEKEERKKAARQHTTELKGIRISFRIGAHDMEIRKKQAVKFLNSGDKVKIEIILRGRENQYKHLARTSIENFIKAVEAEIPVRKEQDIEQQFNKITAIIAKK